MSMILLFRVNKFDSNLICDIILESNIWLSLLQEGLSNSIFIFILIVGGRSFVDLWIVIWVKELQGAIHLRVIFWGSDRQSDLISTGSSGSVANAGSIRNATDWETRGGLGWELPLGWKNISWVFRYVAGHASRISPMASWRPDWTCTLLS